MKTGFGFFFPAFSSSTLLGHSVFFGIKSICYTAVLGGMNFYEAGVKINLVPLVSNDHLFLHWVQKKLNKNHLLGSGGARLANIFACKFFTLFVVKRKKTNNN